MDGSSPTYGSTTGAASTLEAPRWDLSDLYPSQEAPELNHDLNECLERAARLETTYKGKLASLEGDDLHELLKLVEAVEEKLGRAYSFAQLLASTNRNDDEIGQFYQSIQERVNEITTKLMFVNLEINRIDNDALEAKIANSDKLTCYKPYIRNVRSFRPFQLDDEIERVLHEKSVSGRSAWIRLFDETMAGLRFAFRGEKLTSAEIFDKLSSKDRSERREAAEGISRTLNANIKLFARITNTLAKDKQIEDGWRGFPRPISKRNLNNQVEDEVVEALIQAVRSAYPRLTHRYYALKARWMGLEKLEYWDRNAPLPEDDDERRSWAEAKNVVLGAYGSFSPKLASILNDFFERNWIDAEVRAGKESGAFCHPTVTSVHPYVLMNYQGRSRDVMTLAHELGHGVHQTLAAEQGYFMSSTPLTLAETASVFGEQLTFRSLLDAEENPAKRRVLLAGKIEDMLNTVVRQIAFCDFERRVHDARAKAELTPNEIADHWMAVQKESLGDSFDWRDEYRVYWSYIPHFIHAPFYVYAYAFGDCLVNSLYAVYEQQPEGFEDRYIKLLRAGGTLQHKELLQPFGLDATDSDFWNKGLSVIEGLIDRLAIELGERHGPSA